MMIFRFFWPFYQAATVFGILFLQYLLVVLVSRQVEHVYVSTEPPASGAASGGDDVSGKGCAGGYKRNLHNDKR